MKAPGDSMNRSADARLNELVLVQCEVMAC